MTVRSIQSTVRGVAGAASVALLSMTASQASAYEPIMLEKLGVVRMAAPDAGNAPRETSTASPADPTGSAVAAADPAPTASTDQVPYMIMLERLGAVRMARQDIPAASIEVADRR